MSEEQLTEKFPPVKKVEIENFKSIKHVELDCRRINVFIGEPNTGKSNILEAVVGIPSSCYYRYSNVSINSFIRHQNLSNLFYDNSLDEKIRISFQRFNDKQNFVIQIAYLDGSYKFSVEPDLMPQSDFPPSVHELNKYKFREISKRFKFYRFNRFANFKEIKKTNFLLPPDGRNLFSVYITHKSVKSICKEIFARFGLKVLIEPESNELKIVKETEDLLVMYPYTTISDTIQRLIFYVSAILTNKNSIIAMEEPEAHAFPFYTKYLAELIALDDSNQYFITTHNPYFLLTLIEKTPKKDLAVYVTYYENYQTKVKKLSERKIQEILDLGSSAFFNLDILLED